MKSYFNWILLGLVSLCSNTATRGGEPYHFVKEIPIGGEGGWDYLSIDPAGHRLYLSHATKVVVGLGSPPIVFCTCPIDDSKRVRIRV